jgi:hypothetical protein
MQRVELAVDADINAFVESSRFPQYVPLTGLRQMVSAEPGLVFDGELLAPKATEVQADVASAFGPELESLIGDLSVVLSNDPGANEGIMGRARLLRALGAMDLYEARRAAS